MRFCFNDCNVMTAFLCSKSSIVLHPEYILFHIYLVAFITGQNISFCTQKFQGSIDCFL